jgi:hypothetical protein
MHRQEGRRSLNERFEDLCPGLVPQVGNHRAGIKTVGGGYAFHDMRCSRVQPLEDGPAGGERGGAIQASAAIPAARKVSAMA